MTILIYILAFIATLLIIVSVHEFGHFWVARRMGVKVLRFSIGMGTPLWSRTAKDGVEYVFAPIPLGGYVKMLDEREGEVAEHEKHLAFNNVSIKARALIVLAGPFANFILALLILWLVNMVGVTGLVPIIGEVTPLSDAERAGFKTGDEIIQVGEKNTKTWQNVLYQMVSSSINTDELKLTVRQKDGDEVIRYLPIATILKYEKDKRVLKSLGIKPFFPPVPAILGRIIPDKPADIAGLKAGDKILKVNGKTIKYWEEWYKLIQSSPEKELKLELDRHGQILEKTVTPQLSIIDGQKLIAIGVYMADNSHLLAPYQRQVRYAPIDAFIVALKQTGDYGLLVINGVKKMLTGEISYMNMGGPVTIATSAGKSASHGWISFIHFLAIFSVNLGIINLFPIPILDGGHLMYLIMEGIKGKPLSEKSMIQIQTFGMMIIASLMMLAFYVDIVRLIG